MLRSLELGGIGGACKVARRGNEVLRRHVVSIDAEKDADVPDTMGAASPIKDALPDPLREVVGVENDTNNIRRNGLEHGPDEEEGADRPALDNKMHQWKDSTDTQAQIEEDARRSVLPPIEPVIPRHDNSNQPNERRKAHVGELSIGLAIESRVFHGKDGTGNECRNGSIIQTGQLLHRP